MSYLSEIKWITVSSLDTFCDENRIRGFQTVLDKYYDSSLDGWPEHNQEQLKEAHKQLTRIIYEAGYDYSDVEEFEN